MNFCKLALVGILALSCSKKATDTKSVPTSAQQISKAQKEALSLVDPLKIKNNEFVYFLKTQEVYTGQQFGSSNLLEEESLNVTNVFDHGDYFEIDIVKEVIDHVAPGSPHSQFKDILYVGKQISTDTGDTQEPPENVKFYNLVVQNQKVDKPAKVLEREPCSADDCKLNVKRITYDIVYSESGKPSETTSVETWISPDVPYFASILKNCFTTVVSIETARPLVRQCKSVYDYQ